MLLGEKNGVIGERKSRSFFFAFFAAGVSQKAPNFFFGKKTLASQNKTQKKSSYEEEVFVPLSHASHTRIDRSIDRIDFLNVSTR